MWRATYPALLWLASLSAVAAPQISGVTPAQIPYGHDTQITVSVVDVDEAAQLTLQPGGPYVSADYALPNALWVSPLAEHNRTLVGTRDEWVLLNDAAIETRLPLGFSAVRLAASDQFAVAMDARGTAQVFDLRRAGRVRKHSQFRLPAPCRAMWLDQTTVFALLDDGRVLRADVSMVGYALLELTRLPADTSHFISYQGRCYAATPTGGVIIAECGAHWRERARFVTSGTVRELRTDGRLLYVADGVNGLTLLDVGDATQPRLVGSNNKLGDVHHIAIGDGRALAGTARGDLLLLDTTRTALPLLLSRYRNDAAPGALALQDDAAWQTTATGVQRIDFSAEAAPLLSDEGVNLGGSRRATIDGNFLYVADWFSGLHIYDISDPQQLRHAGNFHTPGSSKGVLVQQGIAYVADDDHGVQVLDIKDPAAPQLLGNIPTTGLAYTMKLIGMRLYIADHRGGLHIVDVGDPRNPRTLGSYDTPGKAWAVEVRDRYAYVADDSTGLLVLDIADPKNISLAGQFSPGGAAEDVKIRDQTAFVTFFDQGLYVLDLSDPTTPAVVSHTPIPGNARGIELQGRYAYIAAWEAGLQVVDIGDPAKARIVGYYDTDGATWSVSLHDEMIYALDWWGGVKSINVRNPQRPTLASRYHARTAITDVVLSERFALTAAGDAGLQIFDIRNPLNPIWVTGVELPAPAAGVAVRGTSGWVATETGLAEIDLHDPFSARLTRLLRSEQPLLGVRAARDQVFTWDAQNTLFSVMPETSALQRIDSNVLDVWTDAAVLYLARGVNGITRRDTATGARLDHPTDAAARLVRAQGDRGVAVLGDAQLIFFTVDERRLSIESTLALEARVRDVQLSGHECLLTLDGDLFVVLDLRDQKQPRIKLQQRGFHRLTRIAARDGQVFFAGDTKLVSVKLPPMVALQRANADTFRATLPAQLPMGSYDLLLQSGSNPAVTLRNAVKVTIKTGKKPQMSPEHFQRLLEQQRTTPAVGR